MKPLVLVILDGWGLRAEPAGNAIAQAHLPNFRTWLQNYPHSAIDASGTAVGLPPGLMGNSEVGHLNIGAGRIVYVGLTKIFSGIENGSFFKNPALLQAFTAAQNKHSTLHLMGLLSDGGVHSHQEHLYALLEMAQRMGLKRVAIHAFMDGRDADPTAGVEYIQALQTQLKKIGVGQLATVTGRYYAMDRDQHWERTKIAYDAIVSSLGTPTRDVVASLQQAYARQETDEFIQALICVDEQGQALAQIRDQDAVVFFNFRADRARQLTYAFTAENFSGFTRKLFPKLSSYVCMGDYDKKLKLAVAYPSEPIKNTLAQVLADHQLKQIRIAETEKYAHVTFFFNGGEETVFPGEERVLIPSPREVPTYDLKPEMSAQKIGAEVVQRLQSKKYDVVIVNFANPDMVGHTGNLSAAIAAVEIVDAELGKIYREVAAQGGTMLITADHGNCEKMADASGRPFTAHTNELVPFLLLSEKYQGAKLRSQGSLADVAPTLLDILGIPQPSEMTGQTMIVHS